MTGCLWLTISGGLAEIGGFLLAFFEIRVTQRRELPDYRPLHHRVLATVRRKLGLAKPKVIVASGTTSVSAAATANYEVTRAPATTVEARLERLEREVQDLRRKQREDQATLESRIDETDRRLGETETSLRAERAQVEAQRKETLRESLTYAKFGIALFVIGVVLSVLGNAVPC